MKMNVLLITTLCVLLSVLITSSSANDNSSSSKSCDNKTPSYGSCGHNACLCAPGIPGMPGSPGPAGPAGVAGSPGSHGPEGAMGLRGIKGDEGPRGRQGLKGPQGPQGSSDSAGPPGNTGSKGTRGIQGPQGSRGPQGSAGPAGPPGSKGNTGARGNQGPKGVQGSPGSLGRRWKQCAFKNLNDDRDTGLIKECIFKKKSDNTALKVYWAGNLRIANCDSCCSRWYFTFNGAECSTPDAIDGVVYMHHGTGGKHLKYLLRPRHIEGVCEKLRKGTVRVVFWVGKCAGQRSADAYTGWNSASRIYVEEIPPPQA